MKKQDDFRRGSLAGKNYDRFEHEVPWYSKTQRLVGERLAENLAHIKQPRILEIGCGTGGTTEQIIRHVPHCKLTALDDSQKMINEARARVRNRNVTWLLGDAMHLLCVHPPRWPNEFDAIVSALTIHNFGPHLRSCLFRGMSWCMRNKGWMINADLYACNDESRHTGDLALHIMGLDIFADDPAYRLKWLTHCLEDERIKFTRHEQRTHMDGGSWNNISFTPITRMVALFAAQYRPLD
jgi:cyclopropane fatty-acyl-phospholipid synthase-like methyltransferase